jgi:hypothetical protein
LKTGTDRSISFLIIGNWNQMLALGLGSAPLPNPVTMITFLHILEKVTKEIGSEHTKLLSTILGIE